MYTNTLTQSIILTVVIYLTRSTAKPVVITADQMEPECVHQLSEKLDSCLGQFDSQLGFYKRLLTTDDQWKNMQSSLCQDYQEALMCVHRALVTCEGSRNHLDTVQQRLGAVREFMIHVCATASQMDTDTAKSSQLVTPSTTALPTRSTTTEKVTAKPHKTTSKSTNSQDYTISSTDGKTVASPTDVPSSGPSMHHSKEFTQASSQQQKAVKDNVGSILDCLKNKRNNVSVCVEYFFTGSKNSARNFQSTSTVLSFLSVALVLLL